MIHSVSQLPAKRQGSATREQGRINRSYTNVYQVIADASEDQNSVMTAVGIPAFSSVFASDPQCRVINKNATELTSGPRVQWEVTVEYGNQTYEYPWHPYTPVLKSFSWDRREVAVNRDLDGEPIVNTAGDAFDPPVTIEQPLPSKTINVNLLDSDFSTSWLSQYFMAVNDSTYDGWAKGQALVTDISASEQLYTDEDGTDYTYYSVQIKITFCGDEKGWQPYILSQGMRQTGGEGDDKLAPITINGREITSPVPLSEDGYALLGEDAEEGAVFIKFKLYNEVSFSDLEF